MTEMLTARKAPTNIVTCPGATARRLASGGPIGAWRVVVLVALSATAARGDDGFAPRFSDRAAFARFVAEGRDSPFGLDYVFVHSPGSRDQKLIDSICSQVAIRWVNLSDLSWAKVEKSPPRNGRHSYDWSDLDGAVRAWQRNGVHSLISLRFASPWATAPKSDKEFQYLKGIFKNLVLAGNDYLPKRERLQDLRDYIRSLVERYDGDGQDDMPGLLFPVLHYQVGNEFYNEVFWAGTVEEYGELLREVAAAARAACRDVRVVLSGIGFRTVHGYYASDMDPRTDAYVRDMLPKVPANMRPFIARSEEFSRKSATFHDAYDILDARWPDYGIVAESRKLLRQVGAADKPVWSAEIYSGFPLMEPLVLTNWTLRAWPTPSRSQAYLSVLKNPKDPQFEAVNAWYRGLQAAQVVKICMVALDAGSQKLMMGWAVDAQHPLAVSTLSHHGLYSITFRRLWPAAHTYNLLIEKLDGLERVERLHLPDDIYVYECRLKGGGRVWVAFHDDHIGQNHDEPTGKVTAEIPIAARDVRVTHTITQIGQTTPRVEHARPDGGKLRLTLTEYPVLIEVGEPAGK